MILAKRAKTVFSETGASFGGIAHMYIDINSLTALKYLVVKGSFISSH